MEKFTVILIISDTEHSSHRPATSFKWKSNSEEWFQLKLTMLYIPEQIEDYRASSIIRSEWSRRLSVNIILFY